MGDVLLSGPLVRAVSSSHRVTYLCSPIGEPAARLLPGVGATMVARAGWIEADGPAVTGPAVAELVERLGRLAVDEAVILTSFHQSPLPLALLLRMAGVPRIGAISVDFPGTLLDVRHLVDEDIHEVERALSLGRALGHELPAGDDGRLAVCLPDGDSSLPTLPPAPYVVVHPGASVPARAWAPHSFAELVRRLAGDGWAVVVTGSPGETAMTAEVAGDAAVDLGGRTDLGGMARVLAGARAMVVANTGPAHLAAAVGVPVVSLFAPTVPASRWRPWGVAHVLLGDQEIACAGCRARVCPVAGHPCLASVGVDDAAEAVRILTAA
jgi:ADP-heptose:LPS heptosyltransferase